MLRFSKRSRLTFSSIPDDARSEEGSGTRRRDSNSHKASSPTGTQGANSSLWGTRAPATPLPPPPAVPPSLRLPAVPARKVNPPPLPRAASGRTSLPAVPAPSLPPPPLPSRASTIALPKVSAPAPRPAPPTDRRADDRTDSPAEPGAGRARPGWGYSLALLAMGVVAGISASSAISHFSALRRSVPSEGPVVVTSLEVPTHSAEPVRTDTPPAVPAAELRFDTPLDIVVPPPVSPSAPSAAVAVAPVAPVSPRPPASAAPASRAVTREAAPPVPPASPKGAEAPRARADKSPESLPSPAASMSPAAVDALVRERLRTSLR